MKPGAGKIVVVSALDGTFERKDFGQMGDLLAISDSVTKLNAVCAVCGEDAPFTRRDAAETEVHEVPVSANTFLWSLTSNIL